MESSTNEDRNQMSSNQEYKSNSSEEHDDK